MQRCRSTACSARRPASTARRSAPAQPSDDRARPDHHHPLRRQRRARAAVDVRAGADAPSTSRSARTRWPSTAPPTPPTGPSRARRRSTCCPSRPRPLFNKLRVLLLHRADAGAWPDRSTCRSASSSIRRSCDDKDADGITHITLSYTFYPVARSRSRGWPRSLAAAVLRRRRTVPRQRAGQVNSRVDTALRETGSGSTTMADTHAKHHDYHLVNPSPWPAVGADRRLPHGGRASSSGCARWAAAPACSACTGRGVFFVGFFGVLFTMFMWWRDVIKEAHGGDHTPVVQLHLRYGMILFIASEVMFFVAWFWAYFDAALFPAGIHPIDIDDAGRHGRGDQGNPRHGRAQRADRRTLAASRKPSDALPRHLRSVGPAARQHADPAHLRHHGDVGAPRAAREQPQGPGVGPRADRDPGRAVHRLPGLRVHARRLQLRRPHLRLHVLHGHRLPRRARHHRHAVPVIPCCPSCCSASAP